MEEEESAAGEKPKGEKKAKSSASDTGGATKEAKKDNKFKIDNIEEDDEFQEFEVYGPFVFSLSSASFP